MKLKRFFHAADGGADADTDGAAILLFQVDPGITCRHHGTGHRELSRPSHAPGLFTMQKVLGIEILHLGRETGLKGRGVK